jgi:hypothetical protein
MKDEMFATLAFMALEFAYVGFVRWKNLNPMKFKRLVVRWNQKLFENGRRAKIKITRIMVFGTKFGMFIG